MLEVIKGCFNYLFPPKCQICGHVLDNGNRFILGGNESSVICSRCMTQIVPLESDRRWFLCLSEPYTNDPYPDLVLYMPFVYGDFMQRVIPLIKFKGRYQLANNLGAILGQILKDEQMSADAIIPIPLSSARLKERGFNQAECIASSLSSKTQIPLLSDVLVRTRNTLRQTHIQDKNYRSSNVEGAFKVSEEYDITGLRIMLVDDVATTGHTMHEAATMLLDGGASMVVCVALCGNRSVKNAEAY